MAERRMFAKTIVLSDAFLDMPMSARCLYFTLGMLADDDGFVNSPKSIMRQCGATEDDMKVLLVKKFILAFESGVIVVKHWRINNYLRSDRYIETKYTEEKSNLTLDEKGAYHLGIPHGIPNNGIPSIGKDSIGKDRLDKSKADLNQIIDEFTDNDELQETIADFIEMRKFIKKPMTEKALKLMLKKLKELSGKEEEQIRILNQSIEHNWQTVYPVEKKEEDVQSHGWDLDQLAEQAFRKALE